MESLMQDVRYALRMLRKSPGFTAVVVITLALGIGANTAIFSVVNAVLIRPLPFPNANRLVMIWEKRLPDGEQQNAASPATFLNWKEHATVFEQIAAWFHWTKVLTGGAATRLLTSLLFGTSASDPATLGVLLVFSWRLHCRLATFRHEAP
ncbi:MAG: hypothetical protein WAL32_16860 [Terriglobales bacterium]